jgi:hypothetical protein
MLVAICNGSIYKKTIEISKEQMNEHNRSKKFGGKGLSMLANLQFQLHQN